MKKQRVLVVGTTTDYIDIIRKRYPDRALFLTQRDLRERAQEETPEETEEVLADLGDARAAAAVLDEHLSRHGLALSGIACYDDESLALSAWLGERLKLPFATEKAVWISRSKFHSKRVWIGTGVHCPRVQTSRDQESLESVMDRLGFPLVLKPLTGSGSELVFLCRKRDEARNAFRIISRRLARHPDLLMYPDRNPGLSNLDPRQDVVAEEGFTGPEYSCDFLLEGTRARLVRLAGKVVAPHLGTGTAYVYYIPDREETGISRRDLESQLALAACSLGFKNGLFMADFISHRGKACFLEVSPRAAGDCLPWLIRASSGLDTLGLALDVAEGRKVSIPDPDAHLPLAAVRLFARQPGTLRTVDTSRLLGDTKVIEATLYRRAGHRVSLPPYDYSSRILGHVIFRPSDRFNLAEEGAELEGQVQVELES